MNTQLPQTQTAQRQGTPSFLPHHISTLQCFIRIFIFMTMAYLEFSLLATEGT